LLVAGEKTKAQGEGDPVVKKEGRSQQQTTGKGRETPSGKAIGENRRVEGIG